MQICDGVDRLQLHRGDHAFPSVYEIIVQDTFIRKLIIEPICVFIGKLITLDVTIIIYVKKIKWRCYTEKNAVI